ncbi:MAG: DUF47 family protein [Dehalococcoidales bacterium]|nr:DUF47 family protein [Dehalococcoidales bacterium]
MALDKLFKQKQSNFIRKLLEQAEKTMEGLEALEAFARTGDEEMARKVVRLEKEEDELRRILVDELNRTFVTPIDREDIFALSRAIDDVLDYAYTTIDEMSILELRPTPYIQRLAAVLREGAEEIYYAVLQLKEHPGVAAEHAVRAKALENQAESIYREAIRDLFNNVKTIQDVVYILKMREVYRHLSNAADRGDEAANIIGDIVVKMT